MYTCSTHKHLLEWGKAPEGYWNYEESMKQMKRVEKIAWLSIQERRDKVCRGLLTNQHCFHLTIPAHISRCALFESLSYVSVQPSRNTSFGIGRSVLSKTIVYSGPFIGTFKDTDTHAAPQTYGSPNVQVSGIA